MKVKKGIVERIEIIDSVTQEPYCTWVEYGEWVKARGECDTIAIQAVSAAEALQAIEAEEALPAVAPSVAERAKEGVPARIDEDSAEQVGVAEVPDELEVQQIIDILEEVVPAVETSTSSVDGIGL